ncbi:MAG: Bug family tripartite tricarboxylate transporter substrate binding protein [Burkholderiales bacterium]
MDSCFRFLVALVVSFLFAAMACAQIPQRSTTAPMRILLPVVPGGTTDLIARFMQPALSAALGKPVIIESRPGAGGKIALDIAAQATPNGNTLFFGPVGAIAINPALFRNFQVDPVRDLTCLSIVADGTAALVSPASIPVKTVKEFIEYAKARPGKLNYGAANPSSPALFGMEIFARRSGIDLVGVMYKGAGDVSTAVLTGEVAISIVALTPVLSHIRSGQLNALAMRSPDRFDQLPNVPTLRELGYPELTHSTWQGMYVPARVPAPVVKKLHEVIVGIVQDPRLAEKLKPTGVLVLKPGSLAECAAFTKAQVEFWAKIVKEMGLAGSM